MKKVQSREALRGGLIALTVLVTAGLQGGCGAMGLPASGGGTPSGPVVDGNQNASATSPTGKTRGEPNDVPDDALVAVFQGTGTARLQGTISSDDDVDVFNLGSMEPGDVITVSTSTTGSALDVSITLYDDELRYFAGNDDMGGGSLDSFVEETIRHAGDPYYLAVTASPFAVGFEERTGEYKIIVTIRRGGEVPEPKGQTLFLDFDGGSIFVPTIPVTEVDPFSAVDISVVYEGEDELIKQVIIDTVVENFGGLDVTILTSEDDSEPDGEYSTIYFGGTSFIAFGISEQVDLYNSRQDDVSVIFTGSFRPRLFSGTPTAEEVGLAIGNVASHEAGHLLGLNHVHDPTALMDEVNPADTFLQDQDFKAAPLSETIGPFGVQDAFLLLQEILGPI